MDRRQFLANSGAALRSVVSADGAGRATNQETEPDRANDASRKIGRPVRAVSIGFTPGPSLEQICGLVDQEGARGADLIVLPETLGGQDEKSQETLDGPTVSALARLAGKHRAYIVAPIDRKDGNRRLNSSVVLDRRGKVVGVYDKLYPFWVDEFQRRPPIHPGEAVRVIATDFGRLGIGVCFDVNWAGPWQRLSELGAEVVAWSSAYSAGRTLQARAIDFSYYIMSATWVPDCLVFDIDGAQLLYEKANSGTFNVSHFTFDLDRCIFHMDLNAPDKLAKLLTERGEDVEQEKTLEMEKLFVLKARRPGVSARDLARQYGLEERRPYLNRSRSIVDQARGWQFS